MQLLIHQASGLALLEDEQKFKLGGVLTAIISHSDHQLLANKLTFTLCAIHILFNSNKFHKFWMSYDFRSRCTKNGRNWARTQADQPLLGRPAGLAPPQTVPRLQSCCKVIHSSASESWIGCRFNRMDRKACTRIKGSTIHCKDMSKSAIHLPGRSQACNCNVSATES